MANYNGFEYEIIDDEVTITGYTGTTENIVIPDFIDGYPVTIIGERSFLNYYRSSLVLPNQLKRIELGAFIGDNGELTELIIPKSVEYIGDSAFHFNILRDVYVYNSDTVIRTMALGDFRDAVLHGFRGSTAYDYAVEYGMGFIPIPLEAVRVINPMDMEFEYSTNMDLRELLPEYVHVELNNGEIEKVGVDWQVPANPSPRNYTLPGMLSLFGDISNPNRLSTYIRVSIIQHSVTSIESVDNIIVQYDEQPELPQSIEVSLDNDETISVEVSWDLSEFDNHTRGVYEIQGTLQLPDKYANPDNLQPSISVTLDKRYIVSFEAIPDATIDHKDINDFDVETSIIATLDNNDTIDIPISFTRWDGFNEETTYGNIYDYRLNNPPSIDNPDELTGKFTLTVNKRYITSVSPIEADSVEFGTGYQSLPMPSLIEVDYNDDTSGYLSIKWDMGTPTYESLNPQDYTFTGSLIINDDVTYNRDNLTAEMVITLNEKVPKSEKPAMSKEIYIFDSNDKFQSILSRDNGLIDTYFNDFQNEVINEAFVIHVNVDKFNLKTVIDDQNISQVAGSFVGALGTKTIDNPTPVSLITEENQLAFYDREGELRLMRIKEIYEKTANNENILRAVCEPSWLELYDHFIEDRRIENGTAQTALNRALDGSRYIGEVTVQLDRETDNFYWINGVEAVFKILETWGGALKDTIKINDKNEITERKLWIMARRGSDNGLIVEPDHNAESIARDTLSYPKTALWGQGSSLEIEDEDGELTGGHTRYITFEDVEWSIANGDPADKPLGQKWIGDEQALARYGYLEDDGSRRHREGHFSNQDYETPEELLWATWQALQEEQLKDISHEAKIIEGDKPVNLGDTVTILNREYSKPIELQSQIVGLGYDILEDDEIDITVGRYIDMSDPFGDELDKIKDDIKNVSNRPNRVTENSYANIKPHRPFNVEAHGGYRQIQIYWTFTDELYVKHYEIYGSQISDFVPSEQNLLWKGNVSAFAHDVEMDEMWYYYVRAVNYHGTPSDYSDRVQANSMRDVSPDIMFGSIKAEQLEDYLDLAGKLDEGTLDWINEGVYGYVEELEEGIIADVNETIGTVENRVAHLIERADGTDELINAHEVLIQENADSIVNRVTHEELNTVESTFNLSISEVNQRADSITQRVEQTNTRIDNIDLGGTNFITHLPDNWEQGWIGNAGGNSSSATAIRLKEYYKADPNTTYTLTAYGDYLVRYRGYDAGKNLIQTVTSEAIGGETFVSHSNTRYFRVYISTTNSTGESIIPDDISNLRVKLSLGEEQTGWTPNLDDTGELVSQVQTYVSEFEQRADSIELSVAKVSANLEDGMQDLKVNAIAYINITPGDIKIGGDKVSITGETFIENGVIGTAAIANLAVSKAHLKNAIIDDVHINNMSGRKIIAGTVTADAMNVSSLQAISGNMGTLSTGILRSSNNNMELNLNRGTLRMSNAYFTLGNGAIIEFTSTGNKIRFSSTDDGITRTSGMGVGRGVSGRPIAYVGTTGASDLSALHQYFSGFIGVTTKSIDEGSGNQIAGRRALFVNTATNWNRGLTLDWHGNPSITPINGGSYEYTLGTAANKFHRIYVDSLRTNNTFTIGDSYGNGGFLFTTDWNQDSSNSVTNLVFRGRNYGSSSGAYRYNLGASNAPFSFGYIGSVYADYLRGELQGSSAKKFKKNIMDMNIDDSLEFIRNTDVKMFDWKDTKDGDLSKKQVGFIIDYLNLKNDYLVKSDSETIKKDNIIFMHQQVIQLNDKRLTKTEKEIQRLKERIKDLEKAVA